MLRQPALAQPQVILRQLRESFEVRDVGFDAAAIPPEVQVLLLAHPQDLPETAQYAVDQFVLRGGKLILLLDPHSEMQAGRAGGRPTASSLDRLLAAWGVEAPADRVVADLRGAWRVRTRPGERVQTVDYLAWFNLGGDSLNRAELATAQLEAVSVASAGTLRRREGVAIEWTPLLTSSAQSMIIDAARVRGEPDPVRILAGFRADGERHVIAARLRATFGTAFPDGPPRPRRRPARPHRPRRRALQPGGHPRHRPPGGPLLGAGAGLRRASRWRRPSPAMAPSSSTSPSSSPARRHDRPALARRVAAALRHGRDIRRQADAQFRASSRR
jgi:ABC-type uncharacterized transport system involved in gliding motility auxiliary subunit